MKLEPQDVPDNDDSQDLYYNQENGRLELRSSKAKFEPKAIAKTSEDDLLNKALDRLNKGLSEDLLADDSDTGDLLL